MGRYDGMDRHAGMSGCAEIGGHTGMAIFYPGRYSVNMTTDSSI